MRRVAPTYGYAEEACQAVGSAMMSFSYGVLNADCSMYSFPVFAIRVKRPPNEIRLTADHRATAFMPPYCHKGRLCTMSHELLRLLRLAWMFSLLLCSSRSSLTLAGIEVRERKGRRLGACTPRHLEIVEMNLPVFLANLTK